MYGYYLRASRELPVRLLDLILGGCLGNPEDLVVIFPHSHLCRNLIFKKKKKGQEQIVKYDMPKEGQNLRFRVDVDGIIYVI